VTTHNQLKVLRNSDVGSLTSEMEAAALNARNLLHVANRELLENVELGLSLVAAAERYVADIIALNAQLCAAGSAAARSAIVDRGVA